MTESEWHDLVEALRQIDADVAAAAAQRLHKEATADDLHRLKELLNDDDAFLREAAAWPLSEIAGPSSLRELLNAYQRGLDDGQDNDGLTTALIELATVSPFACREALLPLTKSDSTTLRENAIWLLDFCKAEGGE